MCKGLTHVLHRVSNLMQFTMQTPVRVGNYKQRAFAFSSLLFIQLVKICPALFFEPGILRNMS